MTPGDRTGAMNDLQRFLRDLVRSTGVPQNELARRTGMTEKHISWMMTGHSRGSLSAWQALIDAAEVTLPGEEQVVHETWCQMLLPVPEGFPWPTFTCNCDAAAKLT